MTGFVPTIVQVKPVLHFLKLLWERVLLAFSFDVLSLPQNGESSASVFYSFLKKSDASKLQHCMRDHSLFCFHGAGLFFLKEVLNRAGIPTQLFMCIWSLNLIKTTFNSPEPDKDYCRSSGPNKLHRVRQYYGLGLLS